MRETFSRKSIFTSPFLFWIVRMARDMSDKEILKMELDQLKVEVNTARTAVRNSIIIFIFHPLLPLLDFSQLRKPSLLLLLLRFQQQPQKSLRLWRVYQLKILWLKASRRTRTHSRRREAALLRSVGPGGTRALCSINAFCIKFAGPRNAFDLQ